MIKDIDMFISILIPTRKRSEQLLKSLEKVVEQTDDLDNIEFLFAIDIDDQESIDTIRSFTSKYVINYKCNVCDFTWNTFNES